VLARLRGGAGDEFYPHKKGNLNRAQANMEPLGIEPLLCLVNIMKYLSGIFFAFCVVFWCTSALSDQFVHGYTRSNGTYVQPYYRSSPNNTVRDNFSYKGNVNPHTGAVGTNRYIHDKTSLYYEGPDSHGRVGHNGAPDDPQGYPDPTSVGSNQPQVYRDSNWVSLCPPPHFRMTERDGCQAVR